LHHLDGNLLLRFDQGLASDRTGASNGPGAGGIRVRRSDGACIEGNALGKGGSSRDGSLHAARFAVIGNANAIITSVLDPEALLVAGAGSEMSKLR
jgi:hypothetical protein